MRLTAFWVSLLVVGTAALLGPVNAVADERGWHKPKPPKDPDAATAYEVAEWGFFVPSFVPPDERRRRKATATLVGTVEAGATICPKKLNRPRCSLVILASNDIKLSTGRGPVEGDFWVVIDLDNPVDGPEGIVLEGRLFDATIDLSPALSPTAPIPIGTLTGRWEAKGAKGSPIDDHKVKGVVSGMFQLPFVIPGVIDDPSYVVVPALFPGDGCCQAIQPDEISLGAFTVRLELSLTLGH